ncbi:hypothetical protein [Nonomuraea sp. NPDC005501]|uniref:hypothetical protein n=1 Tax=Nonomuraea sp. NPDC005501 TaxID=3156884 RepID=UPI0033BC234D
MHSTRSFIVLGSALVATLTLSQGFAVEALAAPSQANADVTALQTRLDPCDGKGHGCSKGYSDGYADGVRCQPSNPHGSPDSGQPDYTYGYDVGYTAGRTRGGCGGQGSSSRKAQLRSAGAAQGASDAQTFGQCVRSNFRGMPKPFRRGYKSANPFC